MPTAIPAGIHFPTSSLNNVDGDLIPNAFFAALNNDFAFCFAKFSRSFHPFTIPFLIPLTIFAPISVKFATLFMKLVFRFPTHPDTDDTILFQVDSIPLFTLSINCVPISKNSDALFLNPVIRLLTQPPTALTISFHFVTIALLIFVIKSVPT